MKITLTIQVPDEALAKELASANISQAEWTRLMKVLLRRLGPELAADVPGTTVEVTAE